VLRKGTPTDATISPSPGSVDRRPQRGAHREHGTTPGETPGELERQREQPKCLYRFFDVHGLKTLVHGTVKITPPREFNDPFEFSPGISERDYTDDDIREHFIAKDGRTRACYFPRGGRAQRRSNRRMCLKQPCVRRAIGFLEHLRVCSATLSRNAMSELFRCFSVSPN